MSKIDYLFDYLSISFIDCSTWLLRKLVVNRHADRSSTLITRSSVLFIPRTACLLCTPHYRFVTFFVTLFSFQLILYPTISSEINKLGLPLTSIVAFIDGDNNGNLDNSLGQFS